ncbi:MAG: IS21 family transposase [Myxococcota bacterium]
MVTDAQVRKLMSELSKGSSLQKAAMKAGMDRKTAGKYRDLGTVPSAEPAGPRSWRTRDNPFEQTWPEIEARLEAAPGLEAKALLDHLVEEDPERYSPRHLRSLQRRMKEWRALKGPEKRVYFAQEHRPAEAMQTDFTNANELQITIAGVPFPHLLCHCVLPYSNWSWLSVCRSESLPALKRGVQRAVQQLGGVPEWHQTDNSTAATHDVGSGKRSFNQDYLVLMTHVGMKARTIAIGQKEQNGDVESLNGAMKRRIEQHLLLRPASRDFASVEAYEQWLGWLCERTNQARGERLVEERALLRPGPKSWLPEYTEESVWVTTWSTIRVKGNTYSVPSRLMRETVRVRVYDERLEVWYAQKHQLTIERQRGRNGHQIDYRHMIWSLVRRPGAFARYKYREELFPTLVFRRTYDALMAWRSARDADVQYLRILHLAASTMESEVEAVLSKMLDGGEPFDAEQVRASVQPAEPVVPSVAIEEVVLTEYDGLLSMGVAP